jgi:DNA processing protein
MSSSGTVNEALGACGGCRRRSWLLSALSVSLDFRAQDRARLDELLSLDDRDLLRSLGGRRQSELGARYEALSTEQIAEAPGVEAVCRHHDLYPRALRDDPASPWMLHVAGGRRRLALLAGAPVVAITGSRRASDYGVEMAHTLARGLAASGVTVICELADGIASAALAGALEAGGPALALPGNGLGVRWPTTKRPLYASLLRSGCALSELPHDCRGRRWGAVAGERIVARLAGLVVVVEAEEKPAEMALARAVGARGKTVAAMPGRLTSPLSSGTHALLVDGARLVRGAQDVLDLLYPLAPARRSSRGAVAEPGIPGLEPALARILALVGTGRDTPDRLIEPGEDPAKALLALSELELMGLLGRGAGGRYVPRHPAWALAGAAGTHAAPDTPTAATQGI